MVTLGLAKNFPGKVGFFKPFKETLMTIDDRVIDQDAYLMKKVLGLSHSEEVLSPFTYDMEKPVDMDEIVKAYDKLKGKSDLMLIEGTREITTGFLNDVSGMAIAENVQSGVVLVSRARSSDLDKIAMLKHMMRRYKVNFRGVILNMNEDQKVVKMLESKHIQVLGSIPPLKELCRFNVEEVADALGATVIVAEDRMDRIVEEVMVGAMTPETALKTMRRFANKAIITGGDRSDIQMAALSTDTSCLVLTGGLYPDRQVVAKAYELGVPILLTRQDTLNASETIEHLIARIDPDDTNKIDLVARTVKEYVDLDAVYTD
jgi:hypothetical protein